MFRAAPELEWRVHLRGRRFRRTYFLALRCCTRWVGSTAPLTVDGRASPFAHRSESLVGLREEQRPWVRPVGRRDGALALYTRPKGTPCRRVAQRNRLPAARDSFVTTYNSTYCNNTGTHTSRSWSAGGADSPIGHW